MVYRTDEILMVSFCILLFLAYSSSLHGHDILSVKGDTVINKSVTLVCKSDDITNVVTFKHKNGVSVGACLYQNICSSAFGYHISQNLDKNETYLGIPFCNGSMIGIWQCFHTTLAKYNLSCSDPPDKVSVTEPIKNTVTCTTGCTDLSVNFLFQLWEVESTAIVFKMNKTGVELIKKCTHKSKRMYSADFEALNEHAPGKSVKISCHAIAKGITDSENIPHCTTKTAITLTDAEEHSDMLVQVIVAVTAVILSVMVLGIFIFFCCLMHRKLKTNNKRSSDSVNSFEQESFLSSKTPDLQTKDPVESMHVTANMIVHKGSHSLDVQKSTT